MWIDDVEVVLLDLKYCERCGGLWLRTRGSPGVYCSFCNQGSEELFRWEIRPGRPMLAARPAVAIRNRDGARNLLMCSEGGHA